MLRHLGYEAEYVRGSIYLTEEQAAALTGADDITHASDILAAAGTPVGRMTLNGEVVKLSMEHVWVRAHIPCTDYRGAGNAGGRKVWMDLDTGIKAYEDVDNLYDAMEKEGIRREMEEMLRSGDISDMESMLETWEEEITSMDTENLYARKRIIKQEELSYLPLSLQYEVAEEKETFARTGSRDQDRVSFSVAGQSLGTYTSSELAGKDILLSFRPASDVDEEILNGYDSIFDVPAHSVRLKPVLLVDGEEAAEAGGSGITLGTSETFTMILHSGGKDTTVENDVTAGSMYAVTLDNQSITGTELQDVYDETATLKDSVTEDNVYSEEYLGKLLALAGKLYFAQVDVADMVAAEIYDVSQTRSLSEGITGYEVRTTSLYGMVTGIREGSLYIDVDTDVRSVVSLKGDVDASREYMFSTGMISSLYESIVWEELTGYESVSTISILKTAQEEGIDILLISKDNLSAEIEKLNTDETTKQTVINAVNSGKVVTIPAEDVTMGEWSGTGYIVTNPETGAGAYMISGGLNGGALTVVLTIAVLCASFASIAGLAMLIAAVIAFVGSVLTSFAFIVMAGVLLGILLATVVEMNRSMLADYMDYMFNGNLDAASSAAELARRLGEVSLNEVALVQFLNTYMKTLAGGTRGGKYSEEEIQEILENIKGDGFKNNPLRQAYENEVKNLDAYGEELLASGMSEEQVARRLNQARRDLGIKYKDMTPQPLRDYIYEINIDRYGDKLGPTYDWLVTEKGATNMDIIRSSSRPNSNIDKLLAGFEEWLRRQ